MPPESWKFDLLSHDSIEGFLGCPVAQYSSVFVCHYRMSQNRDLASPNDRELNLLSNGGVESFWGALGLELWLFLYFMVNVAES